MEKEPTKKRTEIMRISRTDNRTLKDDLKSRRQLIVIRVNGWTNRGRNKKTKQTITRTGKTHMTKNDTKSGSEGRTRKKHDDRGGVRGGE
jgi:hypothetical protein